MRAIYAVTVESSVSLTAATPKSVLGIRAGAAFGLDLLLASIAFNASGSSAPTNEPILIQLCYCTFASNSTPGTNNTTENPVQWAGRQTAHGCTAMSDWTAEPTVLTILDEFLIHGQQGIKEPLPLGGEPDSDLNQGFVLRVTSPNNVSCRPAFRFARN